MDPKLNRMKEEYQNISVPDELELRVRQSIESAKKEKKHSGWNAWTKTLTGIAAVFIVFIGLINCSATINQAIAKTPVLGPVTQVFTFRHFQDKTARTSANIKVPHVKGQKQLNKDIDAYSQTIIDQYKKDVSEMGNYGYYSHDLDYKVVTDNDKLFAIRLDNFVQAGDSSTTVKIYDVDKTSGKIITLPDLFKPNSNWQKRLTREVKKQMKKQMKQDSSKVYFLDDKDFPEFNFKSVTKDTQFYVNQDGNLVLVFSQGDVAPMYMGVCEFVIPNNIVHHVEKPAYLH